MRKTKRKRDSDRKPRGFLRSVPLLIFVVASALVVVGVGIFLAPEIDDQRLLARGNDAFRETEYDKAIELYSEDGEKIDLFTRKFNLGLAQRLNGNREKAISRFEEVATGGEEALRPLALHMLGKCHFEQGEEEYKSAFAPPEPPDPDVPPEEQAPPPTREQTLQTRRGRLATALESFERSARFLRDLEKRDDDSEHDLQVAKTAIRQTIDEITRIDLELKKKEENDALREPEKLLPELIENEEWHRVLARGAAEHGGRDRRLASRRLRKAQAANRSLTERLANYLEKQIEAFEKKDPNAAPQPSPHGQPQATPEDEKNRIEGLKLATPMIRAAVASQRDAEIAYANLDPAKAVEFHSTAVTKLRESRNYFALDVFTLARDARADQGGLVESTKALDAAKTEESNVPVHGTRVGRLIVDILRDETLRPAARLVAPSRAAELALIGDDLDNVIWIADTLARRNVPASHFQRFEQEGGTDAPPAAKKEDLAKAFNSLLREHGPIARDAATAAKELIASEQLSEAIPEEEKALAALEKIVEGIPEEPEPPKTLKQRIEELIGRQEGARGALAGLEGLDDAARSSASRELAASQDTDGKEADSITKELESQAAASEQQNPHGDPSQQSDPNTKAEEARKKQEAAKLAGSAATQIYASSNFIVDDNAEKAESSISSGVDLLNEVLALLEEKEDEKDDEGDQQQDQNAYSIQPRAANAMKDEMDEKRKEALQNIYRPDEGFTVEKDW